MATSKLGGEREKADVMLARGRASARARVRGDNSALGGKEGGKISSGGVCTMTHGLLGRTYIRGGKKRRAGWRSLGRAREGRVQPQRWSNQAAAAWGRRVPAGGIRLAIQAERCRARLPLWAAGAHSASPLLGGLPQLTRSLEALT